MDQRSFPERFRPNSLDTFLGQDRHLAEGGVIRRSIARGRPTNVLFWGPPGCGKTSLARIYTKSFPQNCIDSHPSTFQTAEVKKWLDEAYASPLFRPVIFWIDEIHRLTRPQQDLFLRAVEDGTVVIVGATTENPSFVLSSALLSRMNVLTFEPLKDVHLETLVDRVVSKYADLVVDAEAKNLAIQTAAGDARKLLHILEQVVEQKQTRNITAQVLKETLCHATPGIAAKGEGRYFLISALHKAVRGSDPQAALYWISRLFLAGEDPLYISRRLIRMSIEDIGLADPQAAQVALNARAVYQAMGSPEGDLALAEVAIYLALAPKSASSYMAFDAAKKEAQETSHLLPPKHILNAPTSWMKTEGFGDGYLWDHAEKEAFSGQEYFPEGVKNREYFQPEPRGFERELAKRIAYFAKLKSQRGS